jgi:hypothetical protein
MDWTNASSLHVHVFYLRSIHSQTRLLTPSLRVMLYSSTQVPLGPIVLFTFEWIVRRVVNVHRARYLFLLTLSTAMTLMLFPLSLSSASFTLKHLLSISVDNTCRRIFSILYNTCYIILLNYIISFFNLARRVYPLQHIIHESNPCLLK